MSSSVRRCLIVLSISKPSVVGSGRRGRLQHPVRREATRNKVAEMKDIKSEVAVVIEFAEVAVADAEFECVGEDDMMSKWFDISLLGVVDCVIC